MAAKDPSEESTPDTVVLLQMSNSQDTKPVSNSMYNSDSLNDEEDQHYGEYFDVMIIGKTGLGKTTTADKLLLANPTGKHYSQGQEETTNSSLLQSLSSIQKRKKSANHLASIEDLSMWHISDEQGDIDMVEKRLKNLLFCRLTRSPHDEVNRLREDSTVTKYCELLSNDTSKIRILDVPGFFGSEVVPMQNVIKHAQAIVSDHLQLMRKILHIKAAYHFKFDRIVYFLPEHGVLRRNCQILQMELQTMETYFGRSIFECMVVVATHDRSAYNSFPLDAVLYSDKDFDKTAQHLQQAMRSVYGDMIDIPKPPIEFFSFRNTCEEILALVKNAKVIRNGVQLAFNSSTCARCNIKLKTVKTSISQVEQKESSSDRPTDVTLCLHPRLVSEITYEETSCHPLMIPKYSLLQRIVGGIAHILVPARYIKDTWPSFKNFEEVCTACGDNPGTLGCKRVNEVYRKKCSLCRKCKKCKLCSKHRGEVEWTDCRQCKACRQCTSCPDCRKGIEVKHTDKVQEKLKIKKHSEEK